MEQIDRREGVFELIKTMSKAEKRNFKLYAARYGNPADSKFIGLFDCLDSSEVYDEERILRRCPRLRKEQLPNMKAHLYRQILASLRLLESQHSPLLELSETIDFSVMLLDRGMYGQAEKMLSKAWRMAEKAGRYTAMLEIADLGKRIYLCQLSGNLDGRVAHACRIMETVGDRAAVDNELSALAVELQDLYVRHGYIRSEGELSDFEARFLPRLEACSGREMGFVERCSFFQAMGWYHYLRRDFAAAYRYCREWIDMFSEMPYMKAVMYDSLLDGYGKLFEGLFMMHEYGLLAATIEEFEKVQGSIVCLNTNADRISQYVLFSAQVNRCIIEGRFKDGLWLTRKVDGYIKRYGRSIGVYDKINFNYKIALLYFGDGDYARCVEHLDKIIAVRDREARRDLQCYARMLKLVATYEAGTDCDMESQIRSSEIFIERVGEMSDMKKNFFAFFRALADMSPDERKAEFRKLYKRLAPYENHPSEQPTFYYLGLLSWLKGKITGRSFGDMVREKFEASLIARRRAEADGSSGSPGDGGL